MMPVSTNQASRQKATPAFLSLNSVLCTSLVNQGLIACLLFVQSQNRVNLACAWTGSAMKMVDQHSLQWWAVLLCMLSVPSQSMLRRA